MLSADQSRYCHCLTRSGTVKASQTFLVGAIILTIESDVFTCTSPRWSLLA